MQESGENMIHNYDEFCEELLKNGFSMGGGNPHGIYAAIPFSWEEQEFLNTPVKWHTGDPETDPWQWRMRVLKEREDIAYSKVFFNTSGYITKEWYPYFLAVRQGGECFEEAYENGSLSRTSKEIYQIVCDCKESACHEIKRIGGFGKEDKGRFEKAVVELQMRMYITICGYAKKTNRQGQPYGWESSVFCTPEHFWGEEILQRAQRISKQEAEERITKQVLKLNPDADKRMIRKFIYG